MTLEQVGDVQVEVHPAADAVVATEAVYRGALRLGAVTGGDERGWWACPATGGAIPTPNRDAALAALVEATIGGGEQR